MTLEESLAVIDTHVRVGWHIDYEIIDQRENGYGRDVDRGTMPPYTYTPYVVKPGEEDWLEDFARSFDTLAELYQWTAQKLNTL